MSMPPRGQITEMIGAAALHARIAELGAQISSDYPASPPTMLCVLKGAMPFFGLLATSVSVPARWDVIGASSYHGGTETTGSVLVTAKPADRLIAGCHVLLVEDIVDTGLTLTSLREHVLGLGALSVKVVTLLDKPSRRRVALVPDYVGFEIPDEFVIGFGLDLDEYFRELPFVGVFVPEV